MLSIGIAGLIAVGAWWLLRETTDILLEASPRGMFMPLLVNDMKRAAGVQDVHGLQVCMFSIRIMVEATRA